LRKFTLTLSVRGEEEICGALLQRKRENKSSGGDAKEGWYGVISTL